MFTGLKVNDKVKLLRESRGGALKTGSIGTVVDIRTEGDSNKQGVVIEFNVRIMSDEEAREVGTKAFQNYKTLFPFDTLTKSIAKWDGKTRPNIQPGMNNRMTNKEVYNILRGLLEQGKGDEPFTLNTTRKH